MNPRYPRYLADSTASDYCKLNFYKKCVVRWKNVFLNFNSNSGSERDSNTGVFRSSPPEVFLGKDVLKICSKFPGEHPCRSVISIKLLCKFIEITLRHGCSLVNLLHISRTPFYMNTYGWLLQFFPVVKFTKFLRTLILKNICERLLL